MKILQMSDNNPSAQVIKSWKNSRPAEKFPIFSDIASMDLPVNEFGSMHLFIESTILEREIFATLRNHIMWAQTSRVQNVLEFTAHPLIADMDFVEQTRHRMETAAKGDERQDDYRTMLPILSMTRYSISTNPRQLIKLFLYFHYLSVEIDNIILSNIFSDACDCLLKYLNFAIGYSADHMSNYKIDKILNEETLDSNTGAFDMGAHVSVRAQLPFTLRAQLVRHRATVFSDDLFKRMVSDPFFYTRSLDTPIDFQVTMTKDAAIQMSSKRNCWIANYKQWAPFLNELDTVIGDDRGHVLPCASGSCPFSKDALLRYTGMDPNPPCPIHLKMMGINPTEELFDEMRSMIYEDNRPPQFWNDKINLLELKS